MRADGEMIADLDRVRPAKALLLDDLGNPLSRSQQECSDRRWDGRGNLGDPLIADDAGPARHVRNQAQRGRSTLDGQSRFVDTADAADFYSWRASRSNEISPVFVSVYLCVLCGGKRSLPQSAQGYTEELLFAVRNPDVLHLGGVLKKPATLSQFGVEPVDGAAFVRPNLLQIAD